VIKKQSDFTEDLFVFLLLTIKTVFMKRNFFSLVSAKFKQGKFVSVGLDIVWANIPKHLTEGKEEGDPDVLFDFCKQIIDATKDVVCVYKPNYAFYEAYGENGSKP
jgi:orotidine-5'-phosphate decarboxylase